MTSACSNNFKVLNTVALDTDGKPELISSAVNPESLTLKCSTISFLEEVRRKPLLLITSIKLALWISFCELGSIDACP
tara:strand:- start:162 stop:395 length:234 start_codon:yes stop_codon:yes gene_type:complete